MNTPKLGIVFSCAIGLALFPFFLIATHGDEVPGFNGFTRPGSPDDQIVSGSIVPVANTPDGRESAIGGTVYFKVLKRTDNPNDPWGVGIPDFGKHFRNGIEFAGNSSPNLDTSAEYLYLYQVVNDRRSLTPIESASIKLIVPLSEITSWGYFSGIGFATRVDKKTENPMVTTERVRPVSYGNIVAGSKERIYVNDAPYNLMQSTLQLNYVPTKKGQELPKGEDNKILQVVWEPLDPALNPNYVMLVAKSNFADKAPSFRAAWTGNNHLSKDSRSTVFGFTSNLPPTIKPVRLQGQRVEIKNGEIRPAANNENADADPSEILLAANGEVPTPRPRDDSPEVEDVIDPVLPLGGAAPATAASSPMFGGGLPLGSGGGGAGTTNLLPTQERRPPIIGGGGGTGGGNGSTSQQGSQGQKNQNNSNSGSAVIINIDIDIAQQQSQQQQQQQSQNQNQSQSQDCCSEVVPAPASILFAFLGLPALYLAVKRRKQKALCCD